MEAILSDFLISQEVMAETLSFYEGPPGLTNRALASTFLGFFALCTFICLFTGLRSGYVKSRHENEVDSPTKEIPILPYWLPYLGNAPEL
jgi:hypothetical protein